MTGPGKESAARNARRHALARLLLGQAQIFGAVLAAVLLVRTGLNALSLSLVGLTCLVTAASQLLFRGQ